MNFVGISSPRVSVTSHALPGPRQLTSLFRGVTPAPHPHVTSLVALWGELLYRELAEPTQQLQNVSCVNFMYYVNGKILYKILIKILLFFFSTFS